MKPSKRVPRALIINILPATHRMNLSMVKFDSSTMETNEEYSGHDKTET